jgi:hypothetical protein
VDGGEDAMNATEERYVRELERSHEALLTTLGASRSSWVQHVVKNAKARYERIKHPDFMTFEEWRVRERR